MVKLWKVILVLMLRVLVCLCDMRSVVEVLLESCEVLLVVILFWFEFGLK